VGLPNQPDRIALNPGDFIPAMTFYMHPDTARALLQRSRQITATLRARRSLVAQLKRIGWDEGAAKELAAIDLRMRQGVAQ
jgi:hypothetical protein